MLRERKVGQVVVPDGVVQAQALVALAPGVAGSLVLLDDDCRHVQPAQPRRERDPTLPAAHDQDIGLHGHAEFRFFLGASFEPDLAAGMQAVLNALLARRALEFLKALQLGHGREQRPSLAADEAKMAVASGHAGLEADPAFSHAAALAGFALQLPGEGLSGNHSALNHVAYVCVTLGSGDVPGERHQIAPVAVGAEERRGGRHIAALECRVERGQPFRHLLGRRLPTHRLSPGFDSILGTGQSDGLHVEHAQSDTGPRGCEVAGRRGPTRAAAGAAGLSEVPDTMCGERRLRDADASCLTPKWLLTRCARGRSRLRRENPQQFPNHAEAGGWGPCRDRAPDDGGGSIRRTFTRERVIGS